MKIKYVNYGVAYRLDNTIYMNKELRNKRWDTLRERIIKHETMHDSGLYTQADLINDIKGEGVLTLEDSFNLALATAGRSLTQYLPVNNQWKIKPMQGLFTLTFLLTFIIGWVVL